MMNRAYKFLFCLCLIQTNIFSQNIIWQKCLGGTGIDVLRDMILTSDHCILITGYTTSNDGDVSFNHGVYDGWIVKIDSTGSILWQKCLGGSLDDFMGAIHECPDGSYIIGGSGCSSDGTFNVNYGSLDAWVWKLDMFGNIQWQHNYGGSMAEGVDFITSISGIGYYVLGKTASNDSDVIGNHGDGDLWLFKIDTLGTLLWQRCLGGSSTEDPHGLAFGQDGYLYVNGTTGSNDGDVSGNHNNLDFWLVKLDSLGTIISQHCYGGSGADTNFGMYLNSNSSVFMVGRTSSDDGDVIGNADPIRDNAWLVKANSNLALTWQKSFGGSYFDEAQSVLELPDKKLIFCGETGSTDGIVTGNHGSRDVWFVQTDSMGNFIRQGCLGSPNMDFSGKIVQFSDSGFYIGGGTEGDGGDVSGFHGGPDDIWVVKFYLGSTTDIVEPEFGSITITPNPVHDQVTISGLLNTKKIELLDITGRVVYISESPQTTTKIDLSSFPSGIYLFSCDGYVSRKLLKY